MPQPDTWYLHILSLYQSAQLKRKTGLKQYKQVNYLELKGIRVTLNMKISIVRVCLTFWRRIFFQILAHPVFKM